MSEPLHISIILKKIIGDLERKIVENSFADNIDWNDIVGEEIAKGSKLIGRKGKKILVKVKDTCYMFEINRMKESILQKINSRSGEEFKDIKILLIMEET